MKAIDLTKRSAAELQKMAAEERLKLQQLKFDLPGGKVKNVREVRQTRRNIARILTLLRQKQ